MKIINLHGHFINADAISHFDRIFDGVQVVSVIYLIGCDTPIKIYHKLTSVISEINRLYNLPYTE